MCGIAGVLYLDGRRAQPQILRLMGDAIAHRGPDGAGYYCDRAFGFVHRRLSIIDIQGGGQPIANEDGTVNVVFNGEIYNYLELRKKLEKKGHRFRTKSDTESLVHLFEDHGATLVNELQGMFAFAIWDSKPQTLMLARDRIGQKPLYYYRDHEKFIFGSEIKAILAHPNVRNVLNIQAVDSYLTLGMVPGSQSIYRDIHKLQPGHTATISKNGDIHTSEYWRYEPAVNNSLTEVEWRERVAAKVDDAVKSHLVADVPIGSFLSGGVDSTVVSSIAAQHTTGALQTFSIGFCADERSELPTARETSKRIGGIHRESTVRPDAAADLQKLVEVYDEPFGDSSAIPTMRVAELASQDVKVVLSGDGGDECFGGYERYQRDLNESRIRCRIPTWAQRFVVRPVANIWPNGEWLPRAMRGRSFLKNISSSPAMAYAQTISNCPVDVRSWLYTNNIKRTLNGWSAEQALSESFQVCDRAHLEGMLAADFSCLLPDAFLVKVDRASMAFGLEVRPPLVDHELVELAASIPSSLKICHGQTKWIFKKSMRAHLPDSLARLPKRGFEIPLDSWMKGPLKETLYETAIRPENLLAGILSTERVRQLSDAHVRGTRKVGQLLWNIIVLASWLQRYRPSMP